MDVEQLQFTSVQSFNRVRLFLTPWTAAHQASLSITNSRSLPKLMSIESVMPSNHLILCRPLLLSPSIFPSIRVFSNESTLGMRWPKYWSFSFSVSPSDEHPGLISLRMDWLGFLKLIYQRFISMLSQCINNCNSSSNCYSNREILHKSKNYQKLFVVCHLPRTVDIIFSYTGEK